MKFLKNAYYFLLKEIIFGHALTLKYFFKKKVNSSSVEDFYTPSLKYSIDKVSGDRNDKYAPRIKSKLYKDAEYNYNISVHKNSKE